MSYDHNNFSFTRNRERNIHKCVCTNFRLKMVLKHCPDNETKSYIRNFNLNFRSVYKNFLIRGSYVTESLSLNIRTILIFIVKGKLSLFVLIEHCFNWNEWVIWVQDGEAVSKPNVEKHLSAVYFSFRSVIKNKITQKNL